MSHAYARKNRPSKERCITEANVECYVTLVHVHIEMPI